MKLKKQTPNKEATLFIWTLDQVLFVPQLSDEEIRVISKAKKYLLDGAYPIEILHRLALTLEHMDRENELSQSLINFKDQLPALCNEWFKSDLTPFIFRVSPL
ncbi:MULTISPECIES: hypothetical protein [unclassified Lactococcus]|uniref:hypothetical protein n=1 Tax=unclassified Lactococcus TaxID=2643510 RepID=UPI0011C99377|nr:MULTISPECIES: hypothetical protein [unclassified Lactococcus]MQW23971.1 hypothetical protein [Lactococcus sp. dk101]TXK36914.1 hypothetical protein FVP42_10345 [Lactococcus sp. dk310]TXK47103.1 hypothetical protein FVP43_10595 [Lactococcus sp. dk322]